MSTPDYAGKKAGGVRREAHPHPFQGGVRPNWHRANDLCKKGRLLIVRGQRILDDSIGLCFP